MKPLNRRKIFFIIAAMAFVPIALFINRSDETLSIAPPDSQKTQKLESAEPQKSTVDTELEAMLKEWTKNHPGEYGIVVREITEPKRTASYQGDKPIISASTYKLFLIYAVLSEVEKGNLGLDTQVINGKDTSECIESLLVVSSNECGWPLGKLIGWPKLNELLHVQGFGSTDINNYDQIGNFTKDKYSSAADEAEIVWRLHAGSLLNQEHSEIMLSNMKKQVWRERVAGGVPEGVEVASKPGWIYDIQNDTGIVYGKNSTYVVAIMSAGSSASNLADLSKLIYDHLN